MENIRVLIFLFLLIPVASAFEIDPSNPVKGDIVRIYGIANPNEKVPVEVIFETRVSVQDGRYNWQLYRVDIPVSENCFTVTARDVETLSVSVKLVFWITKTANAENGVATISQCSVPKGSYDIKIFGKSSSGFVTIKINAKSYLQADENGRFEFSYNTEPIPVGEFKIKVKDKERTVYLAPREAMHTPTPSIPPGGGAAGGKTEEKWVSFATPYIGLVADMENKYTIPETAYIGKDMLYIASIILTPAESTDVRINIKRFTEIPQEIPRIEGMKIIVLWDINLDISKNTSVRGKIEFAVPIEALKGVDLKRIVALRLVDEKWVELPTKFLKEEGGFYHFSAETSGFSYFALAEKLEVTQTPTPTPTTPAPEKKPEETPIPTTVIPEETPEKTPEKRETVRVPGFEFALAIAALMILALRKK